MQLYNDDKYLQEKMVLLEEYAGIRITNDGPEHQDWITNLTDQLSVIFRESVTNYCSPQHSLPFAALTIVEQDKKPFIDTWIKQYGCQQWLQQLIETAIIPVWHLLVHHGIAIEAHGQNMLIEHKQGWPHKVIIRDFHESLEYVESYLAKPELAPIFTELESCYEHGQPDQYYWMSSVEALRELLVDTLFVFNLTDLAVMLEYHYQFAEKQFWRTVYQAIIAYQNSGLTSPDRLARIEIFKTNINTESLLKKKFDGNRAAEYHHTVDNPLAFAQQEATSEQSGTIVHEIENKSPCFQ
jgi:siderophore synthetase component